MKLSDKRSKSKRGDRKTPEAYRHFDPRDKGWTKVVLKPAATQAGKSRKASAAKR